MWDASSKLARFQKVWTESTRVVADTPHAEETPHEENVSTQEGDGEQRKEDNRLSLTGFPDTVPDSIDPWLSEVYTTIKAQHKVSPHSIELDPTSLQSLNACAKHSSRKDASEYEEQDELIQILSCVLQTVESLCISGEKGSVCEVSLIPLFPLVHELMLREVRILRVKGSETVRTLSLLDGTQLCPLPGLTTYFPNLRHLKLSNTSLGFTLSLIQSQIESLTLTDMLDTIPFFEIIGTPSHQTDDCSANTSQSGCTSLRIENCSLSYPKNLEQKSYCVCLQQLSLINCEIHDVTLVYWLSVLDLSCLRELDLSCNKLTSLAFLGNQMLCASLQVLNLAHNEITSLAEIPTLSTNSGGGGGTLAADALYLSMKQLHSLDLSANYIVEWEENMRAISKLPQLRVLTLVHNPIYQNENNAADPRSMFFMNYTFPSSSRCEEFLLDHTKLSFPEHLSARIAAVEDNNPPSGPDGRVQRRTTTKKVIRRRRIPPTTADPSSGIDTTVELPLKESVTHRGSFEDRRDAPVSSNLDVDEQHNMFSTRVWADAGVQCDLWRSGVWVDPMGHESRSESPFVDVGGVSSLTKQQRDEEARASMGHIQLEMEVLRLRQEADALRSTCRCPVHPSPDREEGYRKEQQNASSTAGTKEIGQNIHTTDGDGERYSIESDSMFLASVRGLLDQVDPKVSALPNELTLRTLCDGVYIAALLYGICPEWLPEYVSDKSYRTRNGWFVATRMYHLMSIAERKLGVPRLLQESDSELRAEAPLLRYFHTFVFAVQSYRIQVFSETERCAADYILRLRKECERYRTQRTRDRVRLTATSAVPATEFTGGHDLPSSAHSDENLAFPVVV